jgi:hypothetical protein
MAGYQRFKAAAVRVSPILLDLDATVAKTCKLVDEAAQRNKVYFCVSVTEKDAGSLYLTQLWFNPQGDLRKT